MEAAATPAVLDVPVWAVACFLLLVVFLLALDLFVVPRAARLPLRVALAWTAAWTALGVAFTLAVVKAGGESYGIKYLMGYLVERGLVVDQVLVFALVLRVYAVPARLQGRLVLVALTVAILAKIPFALLGTWLATNEGPYVRVTVAALFIVGAAILVTQRNEHADPTRNRTVHLMAQVRPVVPEYAGKTMTVQRDGRTMWTLAAVVLAVLLTSDVYFAATIPFAFGFTKPPFIVIASDSMAILGFRSLYYSVRGLAVQPSVLKVALGAVLALAAVHLLVYPYIHDPTWALPLVFAVVLCVPIIAARRRTH